MAPKDGKFEPTEFPLSVLIVRRQLQIQLERLRFESKFPRLLQAEREERAAGDRSGERMDLKNSVRAQRLAPRGGPRRQLSVRQHAEF